MFKTLKIGLCCIVIVALNALLGACQDEKTVAPSAKSEQPATLDNSLLERLSGKIAFQSDRNGNWDIYVMNIDGSNLVQLTHNPAADEYPVWSPDGTQIAFYSDRDGNSEIYIMDADGSNQRRLTNHPAHDRSPAWSPDGKLIAFDSDRESNQETYIINVDGSGLTPLTRTIGRNILPAWSPDGKRIAYTGNRYLGWNVYVMNVDTSDDERVTEGHGACRPDWSPDSQKIAFVSQEADGKGDIWLMNPDGSEKQLLTTDKNNYDYYPAWSPDGQYIVYAKTSDKNTGNWELHVISVDGKEQAQLTTHPARDKYPDWASGSIPDELFKRQTFVYEAESSPRQIGNQQVDPDASGGQAVYAAETENEGFLVYGPYKSFSPADYVVSFRLKTDRVDLRDPVIWIDVATDAGTTTLVKKDIKGSDFADKNRYQEFQLPFSLKNSKTLEFRVFSFANANIWVDKVSVVFSQ
jgi:Tol biopolymer transport system component